METATATRGYTSPSNKYPLLIYLTSVTLRFIFSTYYHLQHGWNSFIDMETWAYYAMGKGHYTTYPFDITQPIIKATIKLWDNPLAIEYLNIIIWSLIPVLIYKIVTKIHGSVKGFMGGMTYALMGGPIYLGITGYTHDTLSIPFTLLCLYYFMEKKYIQSLIAFAVSYNINPTSYIALGLCLTYLLEKKHINIYVITFLIAFTLYLGSEVFLEPLLNSLPQTREGSKDIMPVTLDDILMRYNILLLLLPKSLIETIKKRDTTSITLLISGMILSLYMSRGTRILDLAIATIIPHRYTNKKILPLLLIGTIFIATGYINTVPNQTEDYYHAVLHLQNHTGTVLANWDRGYMIQSLTNTTPISTVSYVYMPMHTALAFDVKPRVDYIIIDDYDYEVQIKDNIPQQFHSIGLVFEPCYNKNCTVYKLRHLYGAREFTPIYIGETVKIYNTQRT